MHVCDSRELFAGTESAGVKPDPQSVTVVCLLLPPKQIHIPVAFSLLQRQQDEKGEAVMYGIVC